MRRIHGIRFGVSVVRVLVMLGLMVTPRDQDNITMTRVKLITES
jgi:hypothetical protein